MAQFQYFLPLKTPDDLVADGCLRAEVLAAHGLNERLADVRRVNLECGLCEVHGAVGPGQSDGTVIYPFSQHSGAPPLPGSHPQRQLVQPICRMTGIVAGQTEVVAWVLADKGDLPTPLDLIRRDSRFGREVTDRFGQPWTMPICRTPRMSSLGLPQVFSFSEGGAATSEVCSEYAWAWNLGEEVRDWYLRAREGREGLEPFGQFMPERILKLLAVNYRIGKEEVTLLTQAGAGFLTDDFLRLAGLVAIDFALEEEAKKKPGENAAGGALPS